MLLFSILTELGAKLVSADDAGRVAGARKVWGICYGVVIVARTGHGLHLDLWFFLRQRGQRTGMKFDLKDLKQ